MDDLWDWTSDVVPGYVVGAVIILVVGWIVAWLLSKLVAGLVSRSGLGRRLGRYTDVRPSADADVAGTAGRVTFYVVMIIVLIAVLDRLELSLATEPLRDLVAGIFGFLPNLLGAIVLGILAFIIAKIARTVVYQLARTARLDERLTAAREGGASLATRAADQMSTPPGSAAASSASVARSPETSARPSSEERAPLSRGLAEVVFGLILLIFLPAILDTLELRGLLEPVNELLNTVFRFVPNLVAAALILVVGWFIARIASRIITAFLSGVGVDGWPARLGFGSATQVAATGSWAPSRLAGALVFAVLLWFAIIEALEVLQFESLSALLVSLLVLASRILLGLVIIAIGLWLARTAASAIRSSGVQQRNVLAVAAQAAIVLLFGAMGLREMGLANSIINLAFGILFGAVGVAAAIAFGVGGRDAAGRLVNRWVAQAESGQLDRAASPATGGLPTDGHGETD